MPITLRTAAPEDEAFLYNLYADTRAEELAAWGWNAAQQEAFLNLQFRGQQAHYAQYPNTDHRIILEETQPIGRLFVSRLEKEIRLVDIALLHEHRGRGIGAKLIRELLDEATHSDKVFRLHVEKFNRAQRLYQRLGFVVVGDEQTHYLMEWKSPTGENQMPEASLDLLHYEDYAPHVNSKFTAQLANGATLDLELTNVEEKSPSPRQEQFILTFRGPGHGPRNQQIFNLHHEQLGDGIMFLVPIGMDANGLIYEAVFNRPKEA